MLADEKLLSLRGSVKKEIKNVIDEVLYLREQNQKLIERNGVLRESNKMLYEHTQDLMKCINLIGEIHEN